MKLFLPLLLFFISNLASAEYCIYDGKQRKSCFSSLYACKDVLNNVRAGMSRNDECRLEERKQDLPPSIDPKNAKKGTCLWMEQNKKWHNLGCMESTDQCKYAEKQYKKQAKVECR
jgi:hypothetical protein